MSGGPEREIPRNITPQQGSQPDKKPTPREPGEATRGSRQPERQTRPYHRRLKLERFGRGRDLAPYTLEEEAEIARGVSEWEIQSRRIRDQSRASLATLSQEQQRKQERKKAADRRYYLKHRAKILENQRRYYKDHFISYQKPNVEAQEQQERSHQGLGQPSEAGAGPGEQERPEAIQVSPAPKEA